MTKPEHPFPTDPSPAMFADELHAAAVRWFADAKAKIAAADDSFRLAAAFAEFVRAETYLHLASHAASEGIRESGWRVHGYLATDSRWTDPAMQAVAHYQQRAAWRYVRDTVGHIDPPDVLDGGER